MAIQNNLKNSIDGKSDKRRSFEGNAKRPATENKIKARKLEYTEDTVC